MTLGALANIQAGSWLKVRASTPGATAGSFDVPLGPSLDVGLEGKGYSSTRLALTKEFDRLDPTGREGCLFLSLVSQGAELRVCVLERLVVIGSNEQVFESSGRRRGSLECFPYSQWFHHLDTA